MTSGFRRIETVCLLVLAAVAATAALIYTRPVMVPFVLALLLSYLVGPLVDSLERHLRLPRAASIVAALVVVTVGVVLVALLLASSARGILDNADLYRDRFAEMARRVLSVLDSFGLDLDQTSASERLAELPLLEIFADAAGSAVTLLGNSFLVLIFVVYLVAGSAAGDERVGIWGEIDARVRRYLVTKVTISAVTGVLVGAVLGLFGVPLAFVFGVLAFLLNFIPSVGSIIATLLPLPIALMDLESGLAVAGAVLIPGVLQVTIGNVVEPRVMGEGLGLHPISVLLALMFWGLVWGLPGMILATPLTAVLRIALDRIDATRPIARLLAGELPGSAPVAGGGAVTTPRSGTAAQGELADAVHEDGADEAAEAPESTPDEPGPAP